MGVERQQGPFYQPSLFDGILENVRHGNSGNGGTEAGVFEEWQAPAASDPTRALTFHLMEEVANRKNLYRALGKVQSNDGAPGVDGMTVDDLGPWWIEHRQELIEALWDGSYQPSPVRGVQIPKPGGGVRQLGIPTVTAYYTSFKKHSR